VALFTARARAAGAAGMLSFQLCVEGDNRGALKLFFRRAGAFIDSTEHVGLLLASHAAIAYALRSVTPQDEPDGRDPAVHRPGPRNPHGTPQAPASGLSLN